MSILSLKKRIKDLEDQNRELEEQKWNDDETKDQIYAKYAISEEQNDKLEKFMEKSSLNLPATNTKVVKVLKGGAK